MTIEMSGGKTQGGVVVGNAYDKYASANPLVKWIMNGFETALDDLVAKASPKDIYEIGCGEGFWELRLLSQGKQIRGSDFSSSVIEIARSNASKQGIDPGVFHTKSIYDVDSEDDVADLVVCCEVLEHLENPELGLASLQKIVGRRLILSVPREPVWRILNVARGKYLSQLGNTPGHIQHWSSSEFINLVSQYFRLLEIKNPFPWTMLLCEPYN